MNKDRLLTFFEAKKRSEAAIVQGKGYTPPTAKAVAQAKVLEITARVLGPEKMAKAQPEAKVKGRR